MSPTGSALDSAGLQDARPLGGGSICEAYRARLDGRTVFAKTLADPPPRLLLGRGARVGVAG